MKAKHVFLVAVLLMVAMLLAACQRPATTGPTGEPQPTEGSNFPMPEDTDEAGPGDILAQAATQTAIAQAGGQPLVTVEPQPEPTKAPDTQPEPTKAPVVEQPTAQVVVENVPTPTVPKEYTLQKGEYPYCLARRFNVNPTELLSLNGLSVYAQTFPGQLLKIPQTGATFPGARALIAHPATYTVQAGDTIYTIACDFGDVDPVYMAQINGLESPYTLTAGQKLNIP